VRVPHLQARHKQRSIDGEFCAYKATARPRNPIACALAQLFHQEFSTHAIVLHIKRCSVERQRALPFERGKRCQRLAISRIKKIATQTIEHQYPAIILHLNAPHHSPQFTTPNDSLCCKIESSNNTVVVAKPTSYDHFVCIQSHDRIERVVTRLRQKPSLVPLIVDNSEEPSRLIDVVDAQQRAHQCRDGFRVGILRQQR
jgi:hypothetical protein